jgi:hypothetical protein
VVQDVVPAAAEPADAETTVEVAEDPSLDAMENEATPATQPVEDATEEVATPDAAVETPVNN